MKKSIIIILIFISQICFAEEIELRYGGTDFLCVINDNDINIRSFPSLNGGKNGKLNFGDKIRVTGISAIKENIDGHNGYWLRFNEIEDDRDLNYPLDGGYNWIWSKYVNDISDIKPSIIKFKEYIPRTERRIDSLKILIENEGRVREAIVRPHKEENQDFYTFVWSDDVDGFMYYDIPGTYIWDNRTNEIKHITYYGNGIESAWCVLTNDNKYLLQDHGTSPGVRGISIINIENGERIFGGGYIRNINLNGYEIDIAFVASPWNIEKGRLDEETLEYFESYKENNKPDNCSDNSCYVIIRYRFNFVTNNREFIECYYRQFQ